MKVKLLPTLFLLAGQFSFSQTEKPVKGKVLCDNFLLEKVNVINKTNKKATVTNENGEFIIEAKANDSLVFYAKEYFLKNIKLTSDQIDQNNLVISLLKKPEELDEVVIRTVATSFMVLRGDEKYEQGMSDEMTLEKNKNTPKTGVYDGTIKNGIDFKRIGKIVLDLFEKDKGEKKESVPKIEFSVLAKNICDQKFYVETLKLKSEQIDLFLQFCNADPKSKKLIDKHNTLSMMDFLMAKNKEFKNLAALK